MNELTGAQRKKLKSLAHKLKPLVIIGQKGITENLIGSIKKALDDHELLKVKFNDFKDEKEQITDKIIEQTESYKVSTLGNVLILYKQSQFEEKRKIII